MVISMVSSAEHWETGDLLFQSLKLAEEFSGSPTQCNDHSVAEVARSVFSEREV